MAKYICIFAICFFSCTQGNKVTQQVAKPEPCTIPDGKYPIQNVVYNKTEKSYEVFVLGAPKCWHQPTKLNDIRLGRIEEGEKEKAILVVGNGQPSNILVSQDYSLQMVETVIENGKEKTTEPSAWTPFLTGAAGGLVGGMLGGVVADKMSNRGNQPVQPQTQYSQNENSRPQREPQKNSFFQKKKESQGNTKIYQKGSQRASSAKGKFFKSKRR